MSAASSSSRSIQRGTPGVEDVEHSESESLMNDLSEECRDRVRVLRGEALGEVVEVGDRDRDAESNVSYDRDGW